MSLDLTIRTDKLIRHVSTGVYIRENGETIELKTIEDVKRYFPDKDISHIHEQVYYDDKIWTRNITHNLTDMASQVIINNSVDLYKLLWRPKENGFEFVTNEYIEYINQALSILKVNKTELEIYNPKNEWGNYNCLLSFVEDLSKCLNSLDLNDSKYFIESSV